MLTPFPPPLFVFVLAVLFLPPLYVQNFHQKKYHFSSKSFSVLFVREKENGETKTKAKRGDKRQGVECLVVVCCLSGP